MTSLATSLATPMAPFAATLATTSAVPAVAVAIPSQLTRPRAAPDAGRQDPPDTAPDGPSHPAGPALAGLGGRLSRLRIGSHTVARSEVSQLHLPSLNDGLILGADRNQKLVCVRFFRPEPTQVTLVGGPWASQLLVFRALALGARVAVITADPQAWQGFGERVSGQKDRVAVMVADRPLPDATAQQPVLVIDDLGLATPALPRPLGAWQTQLTVVRQLDQFGVPLIQSGDLVLLQRLGVEEARVAGRALRLQPATTEFLRVMADDMITLMADGRELFIWLSQTPVERERLGTPRR